MGKEGSAETGTDLVFHGAKVEQTEKDCERGRVLTDREEERPAINNHKKII